MPLGKVAKAKAQWLGTVVLYTLAGAVTSMLAGVALGGVGGWLPRGRLDAVGVPAMLGIAVLAACRELGWVRFSVPQPHRQTKDLWAKSFSPPVAATLWGLDLGLTVTTRFTFSGVWVLVLLPVLLADAGLGAVLLLAYWLGRALPVWLGPLLLDDAASAPCVLDGVGDHYRVFQRIHVLGLVVIFIALLVL